MKRQLLLIVMIIASLSAYSQGFKVFAYSGYTFGDKFPVYGGSGKIHGGQTFGGSLAYEINPLYEIELSYTYQNSRVVVQSQASGLDINSMASINHFLIGTNRIMPISEKSEAFGGAKIGLVYFASNADDFSNITKFAIGLNAGISYFFNPRLGLRLQANLHFPVIDVGANLWWSSGSGVDAGISTYSPIIQFGFAGGLVFKLTSQ
ncbi:MAG: porin family protein [Bacteroidales bacterium]|nr:porin family protein [Bacteroidales bacterium]